MTEKRQRQLRHKEAGSAGGWYGCEACLKFKIGNYRAKLSECGCAEELEVIQGRGEEPEKKEVTLLQHQEIQPS